MASRLTKIVVVFVVAILTSSWIVPKDQTGETMDVNFFTFTGMCGIFGSIITKFKVTKANKAKFPALHGQSASLAVLQFPAMGVNSPHTPHSRALTNGARKSPAIAISAIGSANARRIWIE